MQHTECSPNVKVSEHRFTTASGVDLNVADTGGEGPVLVLLHGVTRCWQDYLGVLPALACHGRVMALDHRGHGGSGHGHEHYRVRNFVEDACGFVQAQTDGPVVLIGHSLGAMTAAMTAALLPEKVRALVLEDPPGTLLADGIRQSRYWLQFMGLQLLVSQQGWVTKELAEVLASLPVQHPFDGRTVPWRELRDEAALTFSAECLLRMDPCVLDDLVGGRWLEGLDWFAELAAVQCPTLLLRADNLAGGMLAEAEAHRIASLIPHCQRTDFPQLGHNLHGTAPESYLEAVNPFLQAILHPASLS